MKYRSSFHDGSHMTERIEIAIICGRATTKYRGCAACRPDRGRRLVPIARDRACVPAALRVVVQSNTRYCNPERADVGVRAWPFWWRSAMINAVWAAQRAGYEHYTYSRTGYSGLTCVDREVRGARSHPPRAQDGVWWARVCVTAKRLTIIRYLLNKGRRGWATWGQEWA